MDLIKPIPACLQTGAAPFRFYVIFHKFLSEEAYSLCKREDLWRYVRFCAVNSAIEKKVPASLADLVFSEKQLASYDPFLQFNKFCESSVFFHVYKNQELLLNSFPFVGFLHYDMKLDPRIFDTVREHQHETKTLFVHYSEPPFRHLEQIIRGDGWNEIIHRYNLFFGKKHTLAEVLMGQIPLYHCYVIPQDVFRRMMQFAEIATPLLFEMLEHSTRHLPYHMERLHGLFLLLQTLDGHIDKWVPLPGIDHRSDLNDPWQDELRNSVAVN